MILLAATLVPAAVAPGPAGAATVTVSPAADATVRSDQPDARLGSSTTVQADNAPQMQALLRFFVTGLSEPVSRAVLRLNVTNGSSNGPKVRVPAGPWDETTVTWSTRPAAQAAVVADMGPVTAGTWTEVNLSSLVTGNGTYDLILVADSSDGVAFRSREATSNRPQLVVETGTTPPPPPGEPEADATVQEGSPNTNFGTAATLQSDSSPRLQSYLRFGVSGLTEPVSRATLRLYTTNGTSNGPEVWPAASSWGESTITWSNRPALGAGPAADLGSISAGRWVALDVTSLVTGNGAFTFALVAESSDGAAFSSAEAASNHPSLVIETGGVVPPPDPAGYYDPDDSLLYQNTSRFTAGRLPKTRAPGRLAPATGALLGVHSDASDSLPKEQQGIWELEQQLGRTLDIDNHYVGNFDYFLMHDRLPAPLYQDLELGRIPLLGWGCTNSADVIAGRKNASIDAAADAMKAYPREFFMRYCWEMDGRRKTAPGTPDQFIAAWRHIWDRFQARGATNVIWVWCANASNFHVTDSRFGSSRPAAPLFYPGDQYVDWISSDGYNWGDAEGRTDPYRYFVEIYNSFMSWARSTSGRYDVQGGRTWTAPNKAALKPIMIAEYGTMETLNDVNAKADWFRVAHQTVTGLPAPAQCSWCGLYSDIAAMVYFDVPGDNANDAGGWVIASTPQSLAAYREAASDPWFNQIGTLPLGP